MKLKKIGFFILKIAIAAGIIWWLFRNPADIIKSLKDFNLWWLIPAFITYYFHMCVVAWRWNKLTGVLNIKLTPLEAFSLSMQGYFFSLVMPGGAIGGDVVKMGMLSSRSPQGKKMDGAFTILMDRIVGMIALFALALILLACSIPHLMNVTHPGLIETDFARHIFIAVLAVVCLTGLAASCVIFMHRILEKIPPFGMLMRLGDRWTHGMVTRLCGAADLYADNWKLVTEMTLLSVPLVHLMTVVSFFFIMTGLHVEVSILALITSVTIGNIVGLLPILPGGFGGRDVAVIVLLVASGIPEPVATAAMAIYTMLLLFCALSGGGFFLFDPGRKNTVKILETESAKE
ncbi:MAG: lysylphosphatidylglycerol synthase transmembrane domain-containing protein [Victivallaceae bacterium]|nr:lysylphosphatidylglycerol synthase transmembrane domain-containing protein [Victivallaceae bacterium]